jgi:hypothetical protein
MRLYVLHSVYPGFRIRHFQFSKEGAIAKESVCGGSNRSESVKGRTQPFIVSSSGEPLHLSCSRRIMCFLNFPVPISPVLTMNGESRPGQVLEPGSGEPETGNREKDYGLP